MDGLEVFWLMIVGVMIIVELFSLGLTSIWFGGGALLAAIAALLGANIPVQIVIFVITSILFMVLMRPFALKYINNNRTKTNVDEVIGQMAKVTKKIDNFNEQGEVILNGMEWTARGEDNQIIEIGEMVTIKQVSGVKLIVSRN